MLEKHISRLLLLVKVVWIGLCAGSTRVFYDRISNAYDLVFQDHAIHIENIVNLFNRIYPGKRDCNILDLGCGTGMLSKALINQGFRVIGIDISMKSLRILQRTDRRLTLIQGDVESLPLSGQHLNVLVCLGVWRHLRHLEVVLDEICRVLSKDGNFILGYFPPKLGGLVHIPDSRWGRMIVCLYNKTVHWLGYDDLVDFDLGEQTLETIGKRFDQIHRVVSGQHWYLILACRPRTRLNSVCSSET
jgi:ubiquinone/menaquinone biosynthesis C-methylase UbiE